MLLTYESFHSVIFYKQRFHVIHKCVLYVVQLQHAEVGKKEKGKGTGQIKGNVWKMNQIKIHLES